MIAGINYDYFLNLLIHHSKTVVHLFFSVTDENSILLFEKSKSKGKEKVTITKRGKPHNDYAITLKDSYGSHTSYILGAEPEEVLEKARNLLSSSS